MANPTVVFLHFLGGSGRAWTEVIERMPAGMPCRTIDLPGFGDQAATVGFDVAAMADHVAAAIATLAPASMALVGHSMGAKVAAVIARRAEDGDPTLPPLSHLVLVAGSPPRPEPMTEEKRADMLSWFAGSPEASRQEADAYLDDNVATRLAGLLRERTAADVLRTGRAAWTAWLSSGSREDWADRIGVLATPTLIIAGDRDGALGPAAQKRSVAPHLLNVRLATVPDAGHLLPMECPDTVATLISEHLARRRPPAPAGLDPTYAAIIASDRVSTGTRTVLLERLGAAPDIAAFATAGVDRATLEALVERIVPQPTVATTALAATIAHDLATGPGKGWRFDALPSDREAMEAGLRTLDMACRARHGRDFASIDPDARDAVLADVASCRLALDADAQLDAAQMKLWFQEVRSVAVRAYVAHPATLARLAYSGIANGGDGPLKTGFVELGEGAREPWEPLAQGSRERDAPSA